MEPSARNDATRPLRQSVLAALVGGLLTAVVTALPQLRLAYRSVEGHLVLETVVAMVGALTALLVYGRFRRSREISELLLVHALAVLAVTALCLVALPITAGASKDSAIVTWAPLLARLAGALLLLAAALAPRRQVASGARPGREVLVVAAVLVGLAVVVQLADAALPTAVRSAPPPEASSRPHLEGHPFVLGVQVVNLVVYAAAAAAFTRRAMRTGDELMSWIAAACALGAWARVNYLLFPSLYSQWLYTGDLLRLGFYLLLLVGVVREVRAYWAAQAELSAYAERRRLARDLHDGAVQEIGYISQLTRSRSPDSDLIVQIRNAADRALVETRAALTSLSAPVDEELAAAVGRTAREAGERHGVRVEVRADAPVPDVPLERREALVRIAREAVSNAARHGQPSRVVVTVAPGRLVVADDGRGFDPSRTHAGGFGLTSMRDRAEGLGGSLKVITAPGSGCRVEVTW